MVRYIGYRVNIPDEQKEKFVSAICNNESVVVKFKYEDLLGNDVLIYFTHDQLKRLACSFSSGRSFTIKMDADQVRQHSYQNFF